MVNELTVCVLKLMRRVRVRVRDEVEGRKKERKS
jgi:hypothetical protein